MNRYFKSVVAIQSQGLINRSSLSLNYVFLVDINGEFIIDNSGNFIVVTI
jgi:hypothetical protein